MTHQSTTIESEFFWCYLNSDVTINKKFKLKKVDKNQIITRSEFWCIYLKLIMMRTQLLCSQNKGSWVLLLSMEEEVIVIPKRKKLKVTIGSIAVKCKKFLHFEMQKFFCLKNKLKIFTFQNVKTSKCQSTATWPLSFEIPTS